MTISPAFTTWLNTECDLAHFTVLPLPGDASFRRYYRIQQSPQSFIAMDASTEQASCVPFVAIAKALRKQKINTPEILVEDVARGFLLLSDFGDKLLLKELNAGNAKKLYSKALDTLFHIQQCTDVPNWQLPLFTAEFMRRELSLFQEWFLEKYLQLNLSAQTQKMLSDSFDFLAKTAANQPQVFMHRDYHSANLMLLPDNQIGVLDFQDAHWGPITYDLVSLLRDCYVAWPDQLVNELVLQYWQQLNLSNISADQFVRWFDLMGMQRHLKALLTFSRKYCRDNNENYLQHIPRTLKYITRVSQKYSECEELGRFLQQYQGGGKCMA